MTAFADNSKVANASSKAKTLRDGQYNKIVVAAALCKSREEWDATDAAIQHDITHDVDGAAKKVGAEERETPTEAGAKYTMPRSITNTLAVIRYAWQNSIPLQAKNKKTDKVEHVSLGSLRKARSNKIANEKAAELENLQGVAKVRHQALVMCGKIAQAVEKMADANVQPVADALAVILASFEPKALAGKPITTADVAAEIAKAA
jgi:hypothetical protein